MLWISITPLFSRPRTRCLCLASGWFPPLSVGRDIPLVLLTSHQWTAWLARKRPWGQCAAHNCRDSEGSWGQFAGTLGVPGDCCMQGLLHILGAAEGTLGGPGDTCRNSCISWGQLQGLLVILGTAAGTLAYPGDS